MAAAGPTSIPTRYLVDDLLADGRDQLLEKSVHVQGEIARDLAVTETAWLQGLADQRGFPHGSSRSPRCTTLASTRSSRPTLSTPTCAAFATS